MLWAGVAEGGFRVRADAEEEDIYERERVPGNDRLVVDLETICTIDPRR